MDNFFDLVDKRHSIRRFDQRQIEQPILEQIVKSALKAPSSKNLQPWKLVVVTDPEIKNRLAEAKPANGTFVKYAPAAIVVMGDEQVSDCWVEDCSIAATVVQLAAQELGISSCWAQMRGRKREDGSSSEEYVCRIIGSDSKYRVLCILALGYAEPEARFVTHSDQLPNSKIEFLK